MVLVVQKMFISLGLYTNLEQSLLNKIFSSQFMNNLLNLKTTTLCTFYNIFSSVNFSFKQYPQSLYKQLQIKYIFITYKGAFL